LLIEVLEQCRGLKGRLHGIHSSAPNIGLGRGANEMKNNSFSPVSVVLGSQEKRTQPCAAPYSDKIIKLKAERFKIENSVYAPPLQD